MSTFYRVYGIRLDVTKQMYTMHIIISTTGIIHDMKSVKFGETSPSHTKQNTCKHTVIFARHLVRGPVRLQIRSSVMLDIETLWTSSLKLSYIVSQQPRTAQHSNEFVIIILRYSE